jgi:hypothetical protein
MKRKFEFFTQNFFTLKISILDNSIPHMSIDTFCLMFRKSSMMAGKDLKCNADNMFVIVSYYIIFLQKYRFIIDAWDLKLTHFIATDEVVCD